MLLAVRVARRLAAPMRHIVEVARSLQEADFSARVPEVGHNELTELSHAFNEMADGLQSRDSEIRETQRVALFGLATLAEKRDRETGEHLYRTRAFCNALARQLKGDSPYSEQIDRIFLENIDLVAPLHDIGKVAIADRILFKPEALTEDETQQMRQHVCAGADTLKAANGQLPKSSPLLSMAEEIARYHHERWDGSGYLEELAGAEIPLAARVFALADVYDALRSERVYKPALPHEEARRRIVDAGGAQFDPVIVEAFLAVEPRFVALSNRRWPNLLSRLPDRIKDRFPG
jgi:response regulator RpfG family c-di-GMP phosphodiesterase